MSTKRTANLVAARDARHGKENASPTIPIPQEQAPLATGFPIRIGADYKRVITIMIRSHQSCVIMITITGSIQ